MILIGPMNFSKDLYRNTLLKRTVHEYTKSAKFDTSITNATENARM